MYQVCAGVAAQGHSRRDVDAEQAPLAVSTLDFFLLALDAPTVHSPAGALDLAAARGALELKPPKRKTGRGAFCAKIDEI